VRTDPLTVAGLAGPVVLESSLLASKYSITVGGQPATRVGRGRYTFPATGGTVVQAAVRGGFLAPYPSLVIDGVTYQTGPQVPLILRVLATLPIALVGVGGAVGGVIGAAAVIANMTVLRSRTLPLPLRALIVAATATAAVASWLAIAHATT
jgi:hypothetical protein